MIFACRPNLLVNDLNVSLRFYTDILGFRMGWRWSDPRGRFLAADEVSEEPGTALVGRDEVQILMTQKIGGGYRTRLNFDVHTAKQVDELFREWRARGASIAEPPCLRAWGMYEMRLLDPDHNMLRISAPPEAGE